MKFTFDGYGINDAEDEYKPRVATLSRKYQTPKIGNLIAAAPDMLEALEGLLANARGNSTGSFVVGVGRIQQARAAVAKAKGQ